MQADNSDRYPLVNVEITMPRMLLPTPSVLAAGASGSTQARTTGESPSVRLLYPDAQGVTLQSITSTEATDHTVQQSFFRLFHLRAIPTQARYLLLQILRPAQGRTAPTEPARVSDQLALTFEARRLDPTHRNHLTNIELTPGVQRVVIFLDEEGRPQSSSIDGAQAQE